MAISQNYKGIKNKYVRYLFFPLMFFFTFGFFFTIFVLNGINAVEKFVKFLKEESESR